MVLSSRSRVRKRRVPVESLDKARETEDGHDLGGRGDVEPVFPHHPIDAPAFEPDHDAAQGPVVHVHHPAPDHPARMDLGRAALVKVVVDQRGEQLLGHAAVAGHEHPVVRPDRLHRFVGFDAHKKVVQTDVHMVLLTAPPHFRSTWRIEGRAALRLGCRSSTAGAPLECVASID